MEEKYNKKYLESQYEKLGTWQLVAENMNPPVDKRTIYRWRKEAEFVNQLIVAKNKTKSYNSWAKYSGMTLEQLFKHIKKYGLEDKPEPLTVKDKKLETIKFDDLETLLHFSKTKDELGSEEIGYDEVDFKFNDRIIIIPLGDFHVGSNHTQHEKIIEDVKFILEHPNIYVILMGDLIDNFSRKHRGSAEYEAVMTLPEQKEFIKSITEQLKDRILGVIQGDHEEWSFDSDEFDFSQYISDECIGYWLGFEGYINIQIKNQKYRIYASHRYRRWSSDNPCHGLKHHYREVRDFDIAFGAHRHIPALADTYIRGKMVSTLRCSSYKTTDRFLSKKSYVKAPHILPCVLLGDKEHEIIQFRHLRQAVNYL